MESGKLVDPTASNRSPWAARWAVFWYNDKEIFEWTQDDFVRRARAMAESGVTHVFTFSCAHFRWSFYPDWARLRDTLAKLVAACHECGIKVVEHHSAVLTHSSDSPEDIAFHTRRLNKRQSTQESWPYLTKGPRFPDMVIEGARAGEMLQVDGRTGDLAVSSYHGWSMCPNNPVYRRIYLNYLESLYRVGIDGIMTDDVQLAALENTCACATCRRLFREQYDHDLPEPGEAWKRWHGNYEDPSFLAFLDFRFRSVESFHVAVKVHYDRLGFRMIRLNYGAQLLYHNTTAYCLDSLPQLDWVSLEFCFSHAMRYSWPDYAIEAAHRFALGRRRGIPAGAIIYPDGPDTVRFSWALAKNWGMVWQPTHEGGIQEEVGQAEEAALRQFEALYQDWFGRGEKIASLGFYCSQADREFYGGAFGGFNMRSRTVLTGWALACYRNHILFDFCVQEELPERLKTYRTLVMPEAAIVSDEMMEWLRQYAEHGNTLVWVGRTGMKADRGTTRSAEGLARGLRLPGFRCAEDGEGLRRWRAGQGQVVTCGYNAVPTDLLFRPDHRQDPVFYTVCCSRGPDEVKRPFGHRVAAHREYYRRVAGLIREIDPEGDLEVTGLPEDMLVSVFKPEGIAGMGIYLVNAVGTWDVEQQALVWSKDRVPFPRLTGKEPVRFCVRKPARLKDVRLTRADCLDPDCAQAMAINFRDEPDQVELEVPPEWINRSCLLRVY